MKRFALLGAFAAEVVTAACGRPPACRTQARGSGPSAEVCLPEATFPMGAEPLGDRCGKGKAARLIGEGAGGAVGPPASGCAPATRRRAVRAVRTRRETRKPAELPADLVVSTLRCGPVGRPARRGPASAPHSAVDPTAPPAAHRGADRPRTVRES